MQYELSLISHRVDGQLIEQRKIDGYINATAMCKAAGKQIHDYARIGPTQAFIKELSSETGIPLTELIQTVRGGGPTLQGTWVHPQVAINLAQWLSPRFAVQVSKWVYDWLSGEASQSAQLQFRPYRNHGLPLPFRVMSNTLDVESILRNALAAGTAQLTLQNQDMVRLTQMDVRLDENLAVLLFRRSDPDASTPMVENLTTQKVRPLDKKDDDAIAVSAHLFVDLSGIKDAAHPTYRVILEEVPGLGRSYITSLIGNLLRNCPYDYTDHRGDTKETYSLVEFYGIRSASLGSALRGGSIPFVELVRPGAVEGFDTEGLAVPREQRMKIVLKTSPEQTPGLLDRLKGWAYGHEWTEVLVRVDLPEHRSRVVTLAREISAADVLFVRSQEINVSNQLEVCTETISEDLVVKAKEMFADESGWI